MSTRARGVMDNVLEIEDYKPHVVIPTPTAVHCYPVSAICDYAEFRTDIVLPDDVLRVIVGEWLQECTTNGSRLMYYLLDPIGERTNHEGETEYLYSSPKPIHKALAGEGEK